MPLRIEGSTPSRSTINALVGELAYPPDLGSGFCGFDAHRGHMKKEIKTKVKFTILTKEQVEAARSKAWKYLL